MPFPTQIGYQDGSRVCGGRVSRGYVLYPQSLAQEWRPLRLWVRILMECFLVSLLLLESFQNVTVEERVSLLEIQVADLDQDVNFLFDETVIQDERIFNLEQTSIAIDEEVEGQY